MHDPTVTSELRVSSSASGSRRVGDSVTINLADASEHPMFQVSKYSASKLTPKKVSSSVTLLTQGATAVATDVLLFQDGDDDNRYKKESLGDVRDLFFGAVSGDATVAAGGALTILLVPLSTECLTTTSSPVRTELAAATVLPLTADF